MSSTMARFAAVAALIIACSITVQVNCEPSELEEQMKVLSKQVTALLDRRKEDLDSIASSMRENLAKSQELVDVREEMHSLRLELEQLRNSGSYPTMDSLQPRQNTQQRNDHLTIQWLSNAVSELKTELSEIQTTVNSSVILQNHQTAASEMALLRTDVSNLNKELELSRNKNARYEAEMLEMREELASVKDNARATAVMCGKTKNQLKALQLEWTYNWKTVNDKKNALSSLPPLNGNHQPRHQRILRKHVIDLEKTTRTFKEINENLQSKVLRLEEEMRILQKSNNNNYEMLSDAPADDETPDRINGNEVENYIKLHKLNEIKSTAAEKPKLDLVNLEEKVLKLESLQKSNAVSMFNFSKQMANFDKLHITMLELLEDVENVENKVDKNLPNFRKEISKMEFQMSEIVSKIALLKEDQTNTRESTKAIGVSVSNLKDKVDFQNIQIQDMIGDVSSLKQSSTVQTSKLHDHILKSESSTVDLNATRSTIHLVQELKSFEKEYKSIVNKLPHDCSAVSGPNGVYLISPGEGEPIMATCQEGWTTVQRRYDGSVDFNRNWKDYSNGFGSATGEHWLGNRNLHSLTKSNCTKLEINMKDIYGKYWSASYDEFRVQDFSMGFKLTVGGYHGNASDALDYQNRMEFSTVDNDRDISNTHCASNYEGGWWFSHCQHANLNGRYNLGLTWFDSSRNEWIAVATSEMRVKRKDNC